MATKDLFKGAEDWKTMNGIKHDEPSVETVSKKRLPKKIRKIPDDYFLPRRSIPSAIARYGTIIAAGVCAGMVVEAWINKKVQEDGGIIWEFDK